MAPSSSSARSSASEPRAKKQKTKPSGPKLIFNIIDPSKPSAASSSSSRRPSSTSSSSRYHSTPADAQHSSLDGITVQLTPAQERAEQERKQRIILGGDDATASPAKREPGHYIAIDCEMVGVGPNGSESVLARVSLVNWHGYTLYDTFVRPAEKVTDYRTWVSGVRPRDVANAPEFSVVQKRVAEIIAGKVLVGHAIHNDLRALLLSHPHVNIRDTATYVGFRELARTKHPSLRVLAKLVLGIDIQRQGQEHSSVEDARATMAIFRAHKSAWDQHLGKGPGLSKKYRLEIEQQQVAEGDTSADTSTASVVDVNGRGRRRSSSSASVSVRSESKIAAVLRKAGGETLSSSRRISVNASGDSILVPAKRSAAEAGADSSLGSKQSKTATNGKGRQGDVAATEPGTAAPRKRKKVVAKSNWWNDPL
ncbi:3'-5' exonuclease [Tilletia horrida]|nr:3'-5' exonuclease [Tilletia horrida]KAK0570179.1 3'-5' exonuclease [Tilletia horrida]